MIELKTYAFSGTPEQIGHAHGEELRDAVQQFIQMRLDAAAQYFKLYEVSGYALIDKLLQTGKACYDIFSNWDQEGLAEHDAIAKAAGVDAATLYTCTNYTDIRDAYMLADNGPDAEGCSALIVPPQHTKDKQILVGQTWDLNPEDIDYIIGVKTSPTIGPIRWSIQLVGSISLMGMNSEGLTLGTTNLKTWKSKFGVGYLNIIHKAMRCNTIEDAERVITSAPKSGAHSYLLANSEKAMHFETSAFNCDKQTIKTSPIGWTNHCLNASHQAIEYHPPTSSSLARFKRLKVLLNRTDIDVDDIKNIFSNREDGVDSINRYPEDKTYAATNACMIAVPEKRKLYACCGPSDRGKWEPLTFD